MPTFVNFINPQQAYNPGNVTTQAYPEGGQELPKLSTLAYGEEGGTATTLALGEEGGGFTSFAFGEEGGGIGDITSRRTQEYLDFLREADIRGGNGRPDGQLTRSEAANQINVFQRQMDYINQQLGSGLRYQPQANTFLNFLAGRLEGKIMVGNRLLSNFGSIAGASTPSYASRYLNPNVITLEDIQTAALRDRDPFDLSDRDLGIVT